MTRLEEARAALHRAQVRLTIATQEWIRAGSPTGPLLAAVNRDVDAYDWARRQVMREEAAERLARRAA